MDGKLDEIVIETIKSAARKLTGADQRAFQAEAARDYCKGSRRIDALSDREFGSVLLNLCRRIDVSRYPKARRGPKKKVLKKYHPAVKHVSTAQVLKERKANKSATKNAKKSP